MRRPEAEPQVESLPPPDVRLINPKREKLATPTDDRGLVDIGLLIEQVKATVDPEYEWPLEPDVHHFYWYKRLYPHDLSHGSNANPVLFRNISVNKGLVPRVFHNWLHKVTRPPNQPSRNIMDQYVESWQIARGLFNRSQKIVRLERVARRKAYMVHNPDELIPEFAVEDGVGRDSMQDVLENHFGEVEHYLERMCRVSTEFQLFDPNQPLSQICSQVGKLVAPRALHLVRAASQA